MPRLVETDIGEPLLKLRINISFTCLGNPLIYAAVKKASFYFDLYYLVNSLHSLNSYSASPGPSEILIIT